MAKIHVLSTTGPNRYAVVVHILTPVENNSAGISLATAVANSAARISRMTIGNGAGQIPQADADAIVAGTLLEGAFEYDDNPADNNATRQAKLDALATAYTNELITNIRRDLKFFGATRN